MKKCLLFIFKNTAKLLLYIFTNFNNINTYEYIKVSKRFNEKYMYLMLYCN